MTTAFVGKIKVIKKINLKHMSDETENDVDPFATEPDKLDEDEEELDDDVLVDDAEEEEEEIPEDDEDDEWDLDMDEEE